MNFEDKEIINSLQRGRDILQNDLSRIQATNKEISEKAKKIEIETLEKMDEIRVKTQELENLASIISDLDKDKDKLGKQAAQANA